MCTTIGHGRARFFFCRERLSWEFGGYGVFFREGYMVDSDKDGVLSAGGMVNG